MLKQTIIAGTMLSLSISSARTIASQNEFVFCPPVAQCIDNAPTHCTVGGSWKLWHYNKVKPGIYPFRSAVFLHKNISICNYSIIENDNSNPGVAFSRNDLKNASPMPGNFWQGDGIYLCMRLYPASTLPSDCPFIQN